MTQRGATIPERPHRPGILSRRAKLSLQIDWLTAFSRGNVEDQIARRELRSGRTNGLGARTDTQPKGRKYSDNYHRRLCQGKTLSAKAGQRADCSCVLVCDMHQLVDVRRLGRYGFTYARGEASPAVSSPILSVISPSWRSRDSIDCHRNSNRSSIAMGFLLRL